jgi:hypothetical protein
VVSFQERSYVIEITENTVWRCHLRRTFEVADFVVESPIETQFINGSCKNILESHKILSLLPRGQLMLPRVRIYAEIKGFTKNICKTIQN